MNEDVKGNRKMNEDVKGNRKMNEDVKENRKLFWKEVSKANGRWKSEVGTGRV